jgi:copper(I)-binding protein
MPKYILVKTVSLMVLILLALAACAPATSDLSVSDVWARAAELGMADDSMAMDDADDMTDDESDDADMEDSDSEDMEMEDDDTEGMDMEEGEGMAMHSGAVSAAYMVIANNGGASDKLVSASTDAAGVVEIHTVEMTDGVMQMRPLADGLEIPANGSVTLEPGGFHIMLMDLQESLVDGETITLTLTFESGKEIVTDAEIRNPQ